MLRTIARLGLHVLPPAIGEPASHQLWVPAAAARVCPHIDDQSPGARELAQESVDGLRMRLAGAFEVGDVYRSRIGRTVTQADNIWLTLLTNNTNQIRFNEHYAAKTESGRRLVNSAITIAIVAGLGVTDTSENGFALGWDEIRLPNPLFDGDTHFLTIEAREEGGR